MERRRRGDVMCAAAALLSAAASGGNYEYFMFDTILRYFLESIDTFDTILEVAQKTHCYRTTSIV